MGPRRSQRFERSDIPMVKLIVSDIDGTLIPYGEKALPQTLFPLIHRLRRAGVLFCPASGRQFHSLRKLFAPVAEDLAFLCENGAAIFGPGTEEDAPLLSKTPMPRADALALSRDIIAAPGCQVLISGRNVSYVCGCGDDFIHRMEDFHGNLVQRVERVEEIGEDILKIAVFCPNGLDQPKKLLGPRWGRPYHMAEAGPEWLDFTLADKGKGLRGLCTALGVDLSETVAFGDNWNDTPMLETAGIGYLMAGAAPALREKFPNQCASVLTVLENILKEIGA